MTRKSPSRGVTTPKDLRLVISPVNSIAAVKDWYDNAPCGLQFVYAVSTGTDGSAEFDKLILQGADE